MAELIGTSLFGDANLIAYYRMESGGLTTDSKGSFTLTNNNSVSEVGGKYGGGASTGTGNTDKSLSSTNTLGIDGGAISISLWAKPNQAIAASMALFNQQNDTTHTYYTIQWNDANTVRWNRGKAGVADEPITASFTPSTATFDHYVLTYDGSNLLGYINGSQVANGTASGNGGNTITNGIAIFRWIGVGQFASATIDEVAIFSDALTPAEILSIYRDQGGFFAFM